MPRTKSRWLATGAVLLALALLCPSQVATAHETPDYGSGPPCGCDPGPIFPAPPRCPWYFRAEGMILKRDVLETTNVATTGAFIPGGTEHVALGRGDLSEPFEGGVRFLVGHTFGDLPYQIEFSYFTLTQWNTSAGVVDSGSILNGTPGTLFTAFTNFGNPPNNLVDFANSIHIHETSYLDNAEINVKRAIEMPEGVALSFIVGARHIGNTETLDYSSTHIPGTTPLAHTYTHTANDLWGPQIGGLVEVGAAPNAWVSFEIKGAICNNSASRDLEATVGAATTPHNSGENGTAYVADFNLSVFWRPTAMITTRFGYQAIWINGLALALENSQPALGALTSPAIPIAINRDGTVLYHGPYAGLEVSW